MTVRIKKKSKRNRPAFKRIYALGRDNLATVNSMLIANEPALDVAHVIQDKMKKYTDVSVDSLAKQLTRYKNMELLAAPVNKGDNLTTEDKSEALVAIRHRVDVIAALNELVQIQQKRIKATVAREEKIGVPFQWLTKDIVAQGQLLEQFMEMEFETGLRVRVPKNNSMHVVPHESSEAYQHYLIEKQNYQEVNAVTVDVLNLLEAEYSVVDNEDSDGPDPTGGVRGQSI